MMPDVSAETFSGYKNGMDRPGGHMHAFLSVCSELIVCRVPKFFLSET